MSFGYVRTSSGNLYTDYTFTGQKVDSYIKLIQMGIRWYDPELGRWTRPDPIIPNVYNPQSLNRYAYVLNNPLKYTDPTGYAACVDMDCDVRVNPVTDELMTPNGFAAAVDSIFREGAFEDDGGKETTPAQAVDRLSAAGQLLVGVGANDLFVLRALSGVAAKLTNNDPYQFVNDLSLVLLGWPATNAAGCGLNGRGQLRPHLRRQH